jgi:hypothetical protein
MSLEDFKKELRADIRRLQAALAALEGADLSEESNMEESISPARSLSPETRNKISETMKANWEKVPRMKRALSPAVKAKIAESQRQRRTA